MTDLPADPLAEGGLAGFAERLRDGRITALAATEAYLERIRLLDGRLGAYQHVAAEQARAGAAALDALLAAGTDLGPLMGVPIAIKDLIAVDGMPTTAGSRLDVSGMVGGEGSFVKALRRAGCVILGKTRTVEFALGITGVSAPRGTPHNPWGAAEPLASGGSSSGSAVAVAAGLCAFAIGSDTGGSIRVPAALCGLYGLKTTVGLWPTDGVFPLAPHLDSLGLLTHSARDAAIAFAELPGGAPVQPARLDGMRLGRPRSYFFEQLDPEVARRTETAIQQLAAAGARIIDIEVAGAHEREAYFPAVLPACLIATLGRETFERARPEMDPVVATRAATGLRTAAADIMALETRRRRSTANVTAGFAAVDAWITPTAATLPPTLRALDDPDRALAAALGMTRNTQPANYFGLSAASLALMGEGDVLPIGLQLTCAGGSDRQALALSLAVEAVLGPCRRPPLDAFVAREAASPNERN